MGTLTPLLRRMLRYFLRGRLDRELADEVQFHLDLKARKLQEYGLCPEDARIEVLRQFGNPTLLRERTRDLWRFRWLEDFILDVRYAIRTLKAAPVFTVVAVLTLALGIGANTAIFSFVDALLFRPPAVAVPSSLVSVFTTVAKERRGPSSYADFRVFETGSHRLLSWAAHGRVPLAWARADQSEVVWGVAASANYFATLGVPPSLGRAFDAGDVSSPLVVLENRFWRERWKADPGALGRAMQLGGRTYTIIGVMPDGFRGTSATFAPAVWIPLATWSGITMEELNQPARRWLEITARLPPGVSIREARAEIATQSAHLDPLSGKAFEHRSLVPLTYREMRLSADRTFAFIASILSVLVGIVLLVASANVASLLLTRMTARRREIALRQSLGATRTRIIRQLLTENLLLASAGAACGVLLAGWALNALAAYQIPSPAPIILDSRLDIRTLIFTTMIAVATSILFGLLPALEAARTDLIARIRQRRMTRGMNLLIASQVAGGVLLMTGASLFLAALGRAANVQPGFAPEHALAMTFDPGLLGYSQAQSRNFFRQLLDRVGAIHGVRAAALAKNIPLGSGSPASDVVLPGDNSRKVLRASYNIVDGEFFQALGTRLLRGRSFGSAETASSPPVAIVNESLARSLFPGRDPLLQRVCIAGPPAECRQIVGLAEQGKYGTLAEEPAPYFWTPFTQQFATQMILVIRTEGDPAGYAAEVRRVAAGLDPGLPAIEVKTLQDHMRIPMLEPQIPAFFLTGLSGIGLILSLAGILGVTAYSVSSRTKEIGIRMAIGARRKDVLWVILKPALAVVAVAITVGLALSIGFGTLVSPLLYGLNPSDPWRLSGVAFMMLVAMLAGSLLPAYSATRIDPAITLRED